MPAKARWVMPLMLSMTSRGMSTSRKNTPARSSLRIVASDCKRQRSRPGIGSSARPAQESLGDDGRGARPGIDHCESDHRVASLFGEHDCHITSGRMPDYGESVNAQGGPKPRRRSRACVAVSYPFRGLGDLPCPLRSTRTSRKLRASLGTTESHHAVDPASPWTNNKGGASGWPSCTTFRSHSPNERTVVQQPFELSAVPRDMTFSTSQVPVCHGSTRGTDSVTGTEELLASTNVRCRPGRLDPA